MPRPFEKYKVHCETPQCSSASPKEDLQHEVTLFLAEDIGKNHRWPVLYQKTTSSTLTLY